MSHVALARVSNLRTVKCMSMHTGHGRPIPHPSPARKRLSDWTGGLLDLVVVPDTPDSRRLYLVRDGVDLKVRRALRKRTERHLIQDGARAYAKSGNAETVLIGDGHREERAALRRHGMPLFSDRTRRTLYALLATPLLAGALAMYLAYVQEWKFFGNRVVDSLFAFPTGAGAAVLCLIPVLVLVDRWSNRDSLLSQEWLDEYLEDLLTGEVTDTGPPTALSQLEDEGRLLELSEDSTELLLEVLGATDELIAVDPRELSEHVWGTAVQLLAFRAAEAASSRARRETLLPLDELDELAQAGDQNAATLTVLLRRLADSEDTAADVAWESTEKLATLLADGAAQARRDRTATAVAKLTVAGILGPIPKLSALPAADPVEPPAALPGVPDKAA